MQLLCLANMIFQITWFFKKVLKQGAETYFWPVKGMNLVRELEKDLRIANVICMVSIIWVSTCIIATFLLCLDLTASFLTVLQNGRRHLTSSMNEVSRDLIVNSYSKKKQALMVFCSLFVLKPAIIFKCLYTLFHCYFDDLIPLCFETDLLSLTSCFRG